MHKVRDPQHANHQHRIKNIQVHLVAEQVPRETLEVLHHSENGADHDQRAGDVEGEEVFAPGCGGGGAGAVIGRLRRGSGRRWCWRATHRDVEVDRNKDKAPEEEKLDEEPSDNEPGASIEG